MDWQYVKDGDLFKFLDDNGEVVQACKGVAFCYIGTPGSKEDPVVMHKHGSPDKIKAIAAKLRHKFKEGGLADLEVGVVDASEWPLDRINACIQICDRLDREIADLDAIDVVVME